MNIIRIEEVTLGLNDNPDLLKSKISKILGLPEKEIISYKIAKQTIDSRKKDILFVHTIDVTVKNPKAIKKWDKRHRSRPHEPFIYEEKVIKNPPKKNIIVVGSGPCGLFATLLLARAGLKPLLIERGKDVDARIKDVEKFTEKGELDPESNIQFGEGGAGTFSDGKLYTLINDPRSQFVFNELIKAGAPEEIAWSGRPHIGTDRLRQATIELRKEIIKSGGIVRFETCMTDIEIKDNKVKSITLNGKEKISVDQLVLATGHSARDTFQLLYDRKLKMNTKAFSIGLRIEHNAEEINKSQYGDSHKHPKLCTAKYKMVQHLKDKRPVYTFCMCPGGYVMGATSEEGCVVSNGMSEYAQDGANSNSALLVPIMASDFESDHPLAGLDFQRKWERRAFEAGGSNYNAPVQLVGDFLANRPSTEIKRVKPTYTPGVKPTSLNDCLPDFVIDSLKEALPILGQKIAGFDDPEAILTGVETRSSSTVRIERDENCESNISGIYPAGEGGGHAGGIVSSAIDGLKVAESIINHLLPE